MTKVHILATCRKAELLPATLLVFKTLRIGFPTLPVTCWVNYLPDVASEKALLEAMESSAVNTIGVEPGLPWEQREPTTNHHRWISDLISRENDPFWILDTDVIFWKSVEGFHPGKEGLMGRRIPRFRDKFANAITTSRLHTSLLYIDPVRVRNMVALYGARFPDTYCTPRPDVEDLVYPRYTPTGAIWRDDTLFHDTCSLLYQAIGGRPFTAEQLDHYDHLNFGTISDLVAPHYPEMRWREAHFAIFENPELARGAWHNQELFYANHAA